MNKHPRQVPFRTPEELHRLRDQLFHSTPADRTRAIQRILTLETKTKLSHPLISTAHLLQILPQFENSQQDSSLIQLSATMAIIRFVNGLLDPSQQSQYAIPLSVLAKKIGLPSWFVELRHQGTHEGLPSVEMLEVGVRGAVEWLEVNYWGKLKEKKEEDEIVVEDEEDEIGWKEEFRKYRRIRRLDINKFIKFGDSSEIGKEYWGVVKSLENGIDKNGFYKVLMFKKCIINGKYKWESIRLLYEPLFLYLMANNENFTLKLLEKLNFQIYEYEKLGKNEEMGDVEIKQIKSWCFWMIERSSESCFSKVVDVLSKINHEFSIELLEKLKTKGIDTLKIESKINKFKELQNQISPKRQNDIDDIFSDLENLKKRAKILTKKPQEIKFFESYPNWTPKPFGIL